MLEEKVKEGRRENEALLLMGDFNIKVSRRRDEIESMLRPYGEKIRNTRERFCWTSLCRKA